MRALISILSSDYKRRSKHRSRAMTRSISEHRYSNSSSRERGHSSDHGGSNISNNNAGEGEGSARGVVFPDSFEVLPQPRNDMRDVYNLGGVSHEQQRKFRCRFCGKGYRWKSTMRRHETVECGGKAPAFQCPECPYKARQRGNLTVHYKRHHSKGGAFNDAV